MWDRSILSDSYTNYVQGDIAVTDEYRQDFVGSLRLDSLLLGRISVPDTHLIDGRLFLDSNPADLIEDLKESASSLPPIQVIGRASSLKETLATWLTRSDISTLNGGVLHSLPDRESAHRLSTFFANVAIRDYKALLASNSDDPIPTFAQVIVDSGEVELSAVDWLSNCWDAWITASESGLVTYRQRPNRPLDLFEELQNDRISDDELLTSYGKETRRELIRLVAAGNTFRADTYSLLELAVEESSVDIRQDSANLRKWYDSARQRAIARQLGSDLESSAFFFRAKQLEAVDDVINAADTQTIGIDSSISLSSQIGRMDRDSYRSVVEQLRSEINRWRTASDARALRKIVNTLREATGDLRKMPSVGLPVKIITDLSVGGATFIASGQVLSSIVAAIVPEAIGGAVRASHGGRETTGVVRFFRSRR